MVSLWQFTVELCSLLCLPSTSSWPRSNPALPTMMLNRSDVCGACVVSWQTWSFWVLQAHDHITSHIPCTDGPTHTQAGRQAGRQCNCWNGCRPSAPEKAKERVTPQLSSTEESPPLPVMIMPGSGSEQLHCCDTVMCLLSTGWNICPFLSSDSSLKRRNWTEGVLTISKPMLHSAQRRI